MSDTCECGHVRDEHDPGGPCEVENCPCAAFDPAAECTDPPAETCADPLCPAHGESDYNLMTVEQFEAEEQQP